jgi:hypothetical protein
MRIGARSGLAFAAALLAGVSAALCPSSAVFAQGIGATAAPAPGSAQRRAILDALRPSIEAQIGPDVEFVVRQIRVIRGWAFVLADPQRKGGAAIDGHRYFPDFDDMGGLTVTALLRYRNHHWNLVEQAIGATDVWFCDRGPPGLTPSCSGR